jgi:hypothetical protein
MEGTCLPLPGTDPHADDPNQMTVSGCSCDLRQGAAAEGTLSVLASLGLSAVLLRRRRSSRS